MTMMQARHSAHAPDDAAVASRIANDAGKLLLGIRQRGGPPKALKDLGDSESHRYIAGELHRHRPDDAVLSEEAANDPARLASRRVWIVDPLDGTREFAEPPRRDWAVHVALAQDGELVAGAVALPALGVTLSTASRFPAIRPFEGAPRLVVSRTRPTEHAHVLAEALGAELICMGSAGAKAMAIVRGCADVYVHSGGQWEWDSAAPVAVAAAAGLHVSRLDGSPLHYNQPSAWLPDLLICKIDLAEKVIDLCRSAR
jgi:3'(2'), 5'-bisphosphate nucleotidase